MHCQYTDNSTRGTRLRKIQIYTFRVNPNGYFLNLARGSMMIFHFCHSWHCSAHKIQGFVFPTSLWPHYSTQLTPIPGNWISADPSGLRALPQFCALIYRTVRGEIKSHFTCLLQKRPNTGLLCFSVLFFGFQKSERVPALGFTHCIESKTLVTSEHPYRSFS